MDRISFICAYPAALSILHQAAIHYSEVRQGAGLLGGYQAWREVIGLSADELAQFKRVILKMLPLILEFSQKGGFRGASGLKD